jgi:hypothetical protein
MKMGWNDINTPKTDNNQDDKLKVKYNKLVTGKTHTIRVLDNEPFSRYTHWIQAANDGKGLTVDCPGAGCPVCADIKAKKKAGQTQKYSSRKLHAINVINRDTGEVEIMDKGKALFELLAGLLAEVGDLRNFDIKIKVTGEGSDTTYIPIPLAMKPLTEAEKALQKYDLNNISIKVTNEQLQMLMNGAPMKDVFGSNEQNEEPQQDSEEKPNIDFTKQ